MRIDLVKWRRRWWRRCQKTIISNYVLVVVFDVKHFCTNFVSVVGIYLHEIIANRHMAPDCLPVYMVIMAYGFCMSRKLCGKQSTSHWLIGKYLVYSCEL